MRDINFYMYRRQFVTYSEIPNADKMTLEDMLQLHRPKRKMRQTFYKK
jgi:hypothetical protein